MTRTEEDFDAARRTALEKALVAAREKLEWEQTMVATYNVDKVAGSLAAVDAIEALLDDGSP